MFFFYQELDVFGAVPVRKKKEMFYYGRVPLYFQVLPWHFFLCAYDHLPEGTKLELGRGAPGKHHPQHTTPPPRLSRPANCDERQLATSLDSESGPTPAGKTFPHSYPKTRVLEGDAYVVCSFLVPLVCESSKYFNAHTGYGPKCLTTF